MLASNYQKIASLKREIMLRFTQFRGVKDEFKK